METTAHPLTRSGHVVVRLSQSTSFHLAEPSEVRTDRGGTRSLCQTRFGSPVDVFGPEEIADVPEYRGKNEFNRCPRCTTAAQA